jgi:hypothetical protein
MLAVLLAAADTVKAAPSKTPFFILGGALAAFAVVLSAIGIRRHETFPGSAGVAKGLIGVCVLLVVAAMLSAVLTA